MLHIFRSSTRTESKAWLDYPRDTEYVDKSPPSLLNESKSHFSQTVGTSRKEAFSSSKCALFMNRESIPLYIFSAGFAGQEGSPLDFSLPARFPQPLDSSILRISGASFWGSTSLDREIAVIPCFAPYLFFRSLFFPVPSPSSFSIFAIGIQILLFRCFNRIICTSFALRVAENRSN